MSETPIKEELGPIAPTPKAPIPIVRKVFDPATVAEVKVCHGDMPEIGLEKSVFDVATVKIGDAPPSDATAERHIEFKNILLTTDLSPLAETAVPFAVAFARQSSGVIHFFHSFE